ncbi:protoporphyrinogen oxidase [bacterium BMS3Abin07]|nr:protoporphyrinogen oxidase [bacterium BMS3Abin07]GBE32717.1 protoporphyrinogen oxidase [bacterium BMS3Bbin05]HDL21283.1 FAD-binding protein [Nitrospirota bacterium]HDO21986.1 FAD-binding protein [Nitrospirota bacterium]HDZ87719.1 FAD-binding protein [Nitrospirota bacterium]
MKIILGAGLAGLSAGYALANEDRRVVIVEKNPAVGGLAETIHYRGFRFDLGGHRFITKDRCIEALVKDLLDHEFLDVARKSSIRLLNKYFDYPLKPVNALFGVGFSTTLRIIRDYLKERVRDTVSPRDAVSLEEWVVKRFGRKMFDLYFRQYSEKVWGIDCRSISQEWVAQRIEGLSLWEAVKNAFFKFSGRNIDTLADRFIYPQMGIGEISERLRDYIVFRENPVLTGTRVLKIRHEDFMVRDVTVQSGEDVDEIEGSDFISTIPLTALLQVLDPLPPDEVLDAASHLHFRDLVIVTLLLDRERVTDLTWLYLPEKHIPVGRVHEPKNWSPRMAPEGKTSIVAEYFCFRGDRIWNSGDEELTGVTLRHLTNLGLVQMCDLIDSSVVRVAKAYPLLDVEYRRHYEKVLGYLNEFRNLRIAGRGGTFQYLNMDHAMRSGINAAEKILHISPHEKETGISLQGCKI